MKIYCRLLLLVTLLCFLACDVKSQSRTNYSLEQIYKYEGAKTSNRQLEDKLMLVYDNAEELSKPNRVDSQSLQRLQNIKSNLLVTRQKLVNSNNYPKIYQSIFDNYNSLMVKGDRSANPADLEAALHFIEQDLAYKAGSLGADSSTGVITVVNVDVRTVDDTTGQELSGFKVVFQPFLVNDPQANIEFMQRTRNAKGYIPPGWYKVIVSNDQGKSGERGVILEYAQRNDIYPIEVPVK